VWCESSANTTYSHAFSSIYPVEKHLLRTMPHRPPPPPPPPPPLSSRLAQAINQATNSRQADCSIAISNGFQRGCSSNGRALAQHVRGTGIDAQLLHISNPETMWGRTAFMPVCTHGHEDRNPHTGHEVPMRPRFSRLESPALVVNTNVTQQSCRC